MLKDWRFPWLYVVDITLWAGEVVCFLGLVSFLFSKPVPSGKSLPASWEAVLPNHGKYVPGYSIANHPFAFSALIVLVAVCFSLRRRVQEAESLQRASASGRWQSAYVVADAVVFIGCMAVAFVLIGLFAARGMA